MAQSAKAKARAQQTRTRRKKKSSRFTTVCILFVTLLVLIAATLLMRRAYRSALEKEPSPSVPKTTTEEDKSSLFGVKEVTVTGNTRYRPEAIIQQSGLYAGMSIWSVDKAAAEEAVLSAFPYIEAVKVTNSAYNKLDIAVTETKVIGAMYADEKWVIVGANGKALDTEEITTDRPLRMLYFRGATPVSSTPGETAMDERCFAIVSELLTAFERYDFDGVCEIDLTNKSDLRLNWNNRLTVKLGSDGNLTHEIGVVVSALPSIEAQYGVNVSGQLDVSTFSTENANARAVFTPQELLPTSAEKTSPTEPEATDENGDPVPTEPEE